VFDFALGYPAENNGAEAFPCGTDVFDVTCFGIYRFDDDGLSGAETQVAQIGRRLLWRDDDELLMVVRNHGWVKNWTPHTTATHPDLEWTITSYNDVLAVQGVPPVDVTGVTEVVSFLV
jgi:hypothetical protein